MGEGSNLKLKSPKQSIHVSQQKDKMAKNVSNHMNVAKKTDTHKIMKSDGKKPFVTKDEISGK